VTNISTNPGAAPLADGGTVADVTSRAGKSLLARVVGVVFSPRETYADVAARPRVLGALAVVLALGIGGAFALMSTDVGRQATIDQMVRQMERSGRPVPDAAYQRLEAMAPYLAYASAAAQLVFIPLVTAIVAGIFIAVFNAVLGGTATFKQVFAVVVHSWLLFSVQSLFVLPLDYAKQSLSSPTNLSVFLPFLDEGTFLQRFFGTLDLFTMWWIVNLAIGIGVLYKKRTTPIATTLFVIYGVIALIVAAVGVAFSGA
jgi:hypothetical protein